jgi:hypothetical protein
MRWVVLAAIGFAVLAWKLRAHDVEAAAPLDDWRITWEPTMQSSSTIQRYVFRDGVLQPVQGEW